MKLHCTWWVCHLDFSRLIYCTGCPMPNTTGCSCFELILHSDLTTTGTTQTWNFKSSPSMRHYQNKHLQNHTKHYVIWACFVHMCRLGMLSWHVSWFVKINNCVSNGQDTTLTASLLSPGKSLKSGLFNSCLHSLHFAGGYDERNTKEILVWSMDHEQIP